MDADDNNTFFEKTSYSSPAVMDGSRIDVIRSKFPFCIVWTPIPLLTYFFPFIGHMGIATSTGIIRDFAGPYHVSENKMAFGKPTKYWQLDHSLAKGGITGWDDAVIEASDIYKTRMIRKNRQASSMCLPPLLSVWVVNLHVEETYLFLLPWCEIYDSFQHNLCCDNCHSHVATALNLMNFDNSSNWNMVKLALFMFIHGKYIGWSGFVKTWLPFFILILIIVIICTTTL